MPEGVVQARINTDSGFRDPDGKGVEYFYQEFMPAERDTESVPLPTAAPATTKPPDEVKSQLF